MSNAILEFENYDMPQRSGLTHTEKKYMLRRFRQSTTDLSRAISNSTPKKCNAITKMASGIPKSLRTTSAVITDNNTETGYRKSNLTYAAKVKLCMGSKEQSLHFPNLKYKGEIPKCGRWQNVEFLINNLHDHEHESISFRTKLKEYLGGPDFIQDHYPTPITEQFKDRGGAVEWPYVHVNALGPKMQYEFDPKHSYVYKCKLNSAPGSSVYGRETRIFVGRLIPKTLFNSKLDLTFGILIRTLLKTPSDRDRWENIMEIIMVPYGVQAVEADWGAPTVDTNWNINAVLENELLVKENETLETFLTSKNAAEWTKLIEGVSYDNYIPEPFKQQYIESSRLETVKILQGYSALCGGFVWKALKINALIQVYKNLAYSLIAQLFTFKNIESFVDQKEKETYTRFLKEIKVKCDKSGYEQISVAHKCLSAALHRVCNVFPLSHGLSKYQTLETERATLKFLMAITLNVVRALDIEVIPDLAHKLFGLIMAAVNAGMGINLSANDRKTELMMCVENAIETMKHRIDQNQVIELKEVIEKDFISPCMATRITLPILMDSLRIDVDLSDFIISETECIVKVGEIYKNFNNYNPEFFPEKNNKGARITLPFTPLSTRMEQRRIRKRVRDVDITEQNTLFTTLLVDFDTRFFSWTTLEYQLRPQREIPNIDIYLRSREMQTTSTRTIQQQYNTHQLYVPYTLNQERTGYIAPPPPIVRKADEFEISQYGDQSDTIDPINGSISDLHTPFTPVDSGDLPTNDLKWGSDSPYQRGDSGGSGGSLGRSRNAAIGSSSPVAQRGNSAGSGGSPGGRRSAASSGERNNTTKTDESKKSLANGGVGHAGGRARAKGAHIDVDQARTRELVDAAKRAADLLTGRGRGRPPG